MKKSITILLTLAVTLALTAVVAVAEHPQADPVLVFPAAADTPEVIAAEQQVEEAIEEAIEQAAEQPEAEIVWEETEVEEILELPVDAPTFRNPAMDRPLDHPGH